MQFLIEFARENGANPIIVETLIEQMRLSCAPAITSNQDNPHYHPEYKVDDPERSIIKMMHLTYEHQFESTLPRHIKLSEKVLLLYRQLETEDKRIFNKLSGLHESIRKEYLSNRPKLAECWHALEQAQCEHYLVRQALMFAYYGIGNCSHRACLSGILLVHAFKGTGVTVRIVANTECDQFMVWLIKGGKTYVFDAITNFELIFEKGDYDKKILAPCFPKKPFISRSKHGVDICPSLSLWKTLEQELFNHNSLGLNFDPKATLKDKNALLSLLPRTQYGIDIQDLKKLPLIKQKFTDPMEKAVLNLNNKRQQKTTNHWLTELEKSYKLYNRKTRSPHDFFQDASMQVGKPVEITGLKRKPELNGKIGVIKKLLRNGRLKVAVGESFYSVSRTNLQGIKSAPSLLDKQKYPEVPTASAT